MSHRLQAGGDLPLTLSSESSVRMAAIEDNQLPRLDPHEPYQASLGIDILVSGDLVVSQDLIPGDPTEDCAVFPQDETGIRGESRITADVTEDFGEGRRGFSRFRLAKNFIRAKIFSDDGKPRFGRMTNASVTGLFIRCQSPLPFRSIVRVEWCMTGTTKMTFLGKVVRSAEQGMAIHLTTDDADWRYRAAFIDLCRTPTDDPPTVTVRKLKAAEARRYQEDDDIVRRLGQAWRQVEEDLGNDKKHQDFIQQCLRERRLQFALERYRELQKWPTDTFDPAPYLKQLGTILSFYQLSNHSSEYEGTSWRRYFPLIVVTVLMMLLLLGVPYLLGQRAIPPS
ncbi:MAG: PilZ domain-containing protein [Myxococcota bacterium]